MDNQSKRAFDERLIVAGQLQDEAELARVLSERAGFPIDAETVWGALSRAVERGAGLPCVALLANLATPEQASRALSHACSTSHLMDRARRLAICEMLAPLCDPHALGLGRMTPLMAAARAGFAGVVKELAPRSEVDRQCPRGARALDAPIRAGASALWLASSKGRSDCLRELLSAGADARLADECGVTPLMMATPSVGGEALRMLILASDMCAVDEKGGSAMKYFLRLSHKEGVRMLVEMADAGQKGPLLDQVAQHVAEMGGAEGAGPLAAEAKAALSAQLEGVELAAELGSAPGASAPRLRV